MLKLILFRQSDYLPLKPNLPLYDNGKLFLKKKRFILISELYLLFKFLNFGRICFM
jgi:hypothetical protein